MSADGHNPCEDALATMELVLQKLKHGKLVGRFHFFTPIEYSVKFVTRFSPKSKLVPRLEAVFADYRFWVSDSLSLLQARINPS